jgi:hypothetical protein
LLTFRGTGVWEKFHDPVKAKNNATAESWARPLDPQDYSVRSAVIGVSFVARRAGR